MIYKVGYNFNISREDKLFIQQSLDNLPSDLYNVEDIKRIFKENNRKLPENLDQVDYIEF